MGLCSKLCYALGGVPPAATLVSIRVSMPLFLLDAVEIRPAFVSLILCLSLVWDAATDPLVGFLIQRTAWTRCGRLTPWLIGSSGFVVVSYFLLWFVPRESLTASGAVLWVLATSCVFHTAMTCYNVPYVSLNMFLLGGDTTERDTVTAYRKTVEAAAMLLASVVQGHVMSVSVDRKQEACELSTQDELAAESPRSLQEPFWYSAAGVSAALLLCCLALCVGVTEKPGPAVRGSGPEGRPRCRTSLKLLFAHRPFRWFLCGLVPSVVAFQACFGNFALFCAHAAGLGGYVQVLLLTLMVSSVLSVPILQKLLQRIGKKATLLIGHAVLIPALIVVGFNADNLPLFITMCVPMGFSVATAAFLPWSMLPDVVDDFSLQHPSSTNMEVLFFSVHTFCTKLSSGAAVGLSTLTFHFLGYTSASCHSNQQVALALFILFTPAPVLLLLVAMIILCFYSVPERPEAKPPSSPSEGGGVALQALRTQDAEAFPPGSKVDLWEESGLDRKQLEFSFQTSRAKNSPSEGNPRWNKLKAPHDSEDKGPGNQPASSSGGLPRKPNITWV